MLLSLEGPYTFLSSRMLKDQIIRASLHPLNVARRGWTGFGDLRLEVATFTGSNSVPSLLRVISCRALGGCFSVQFSTLIKAARS